MRFLAGVLCGFAMVQCATSAQRRPIPAEQWTDKARLTLAKVVQIEATQDAPELAWVIARRWRIQRRGWDVAAQAQNYSAPLRLERAFTYHQARVMGQGLDDVPQSLRELLDRWASGRVPSKCPGAVHWAGPRFPTPLRRVVCSVRTANWFYGPPV